MKTMLQRALQSGVESGVFPGATACVMYFDGWKQKRVISVSEGRLEAFGHKVDASTLYDLASLTKPIVATACIRICVREKISLTTPVIESTRGAFELRRLLCHASGLPAWLPLYRDEGFRSSKTHAFSYLRDAAPTWLQISRHKGPLYSDLNYLLLGSWMERKTGRSLDQIVGDEILDPLKLSRIGYLSQLGTGPYAPTEWCSDRGRVVVQEVHDENSAAWGGTTGHAGLFGTAKDVAEFGWACLQNLLGATDVLAAGLMSAAVDKSHGAYGLGWDRRDSENTSAGSLSNAPTFGHLGFTGTSLWCDPIRNAAVVLLTNRVHPTRKNLAIKSFRPKFYDLVWSELDRIADESRS